MVLDLTLKVYDSLTPYLAWHLFSFGRLHWRAIRRLRCFQGHLLIDADDSLAWNDIKHRSRFRVGLHKRV